MNLFNLIELFTITDWVSVIVSISLWYFILYLYYDYKGFNTPGLVDFLFFMVIVSIIIYFAAFILVGVVWLISSVFDISITSIWGWSFSDFVFYMNQNVGSVSVHQSTVFINRLYESANWYAGNNYEGSLTYTQLMNTDHFNQLSTTRNIFNGLKQKCTRFPALGEGSIAGTITGGVFTPSDSFNELVS